MIRIVLRDLFDNRDGGRTLLYSRGQIVALEHVPGSLIALPPEGWCTRMNLNDHGFLMDSERSRIIPACYCSNPFEPNAGPLFLIAEWSRHQPQLLRTSPKESGIGSFQVGRELLNYSGERLREGARDSLVLRMEGDLYVEA